MYKFNWNEQWVGYSLGFVGLSIAIVQGGLIRIIIPKLGQEKSVYIGLLMYCLGFTLFAFASSGWMMFAFMIPYALGGISGPSMQGLISTRVPANEQGEIQGALTSIMSATGILGPLMMTGLFAYFTREYAPFIFPGAPFLLGALLSVLSTYIAIRRFRKK